VSKPRLRSAPATVKFVGASTRAKTAAATIAPRFQKLSPSQLEARGISKKAERYIDNSTGQVISKRQYQKSRAIGQYQEPAKKQKAKQQRTSRTKISTTKRGLKIHSKESRSIKAAVRAAKKLHEETGGSHVQFIWISEADYNGRKHIALSWVFTINDEEDLDTMEDELNDRIGDNQQPGTSIKVVMRR
jgi:hypothetical protein